MAAAPSTSALATITRVVAIALVPFLAVAAVILFAFPARTGELFAWPIEPPLSAAVLGFMLDVPEALRPLLRGQHLLAA